MGKLIFRLGKIGWRPQLVNPLIVRLRTKTIVTVGNQMELIASKT